MIKQLTKFIIRPQHFAMQSFGSHASVPDKLSKVANKCVKMNVKNFLGQWEQVPAFVGESFLDALIRMNVKTFQGNICLGGDFTYQPHERPHDPFCSGPNCGICRIYLKGNWYARVHQQTEGMSDTEEHLLIAHEDHRENLRLACCIPVEEWMDGVQFEMVPKLYVGSRDEFDDN